MGTVKKFFGIDEAKTFKNRGIALNIKRLKQMPHLQRISQRSLL
jgi:hypothetical protein